jgi:uncharacterized protein
MGSTRSRFILAQEGSMAHRRFFLILLLAAIPGLSSLAWTGGLRLAQAGVATADVVGMSFPLYPEQKVVYHLKTDGGFRNRAYRNLLLIANHHMDAVGEGWLDLRIVMQGDGIQLLAAAKSDAALAASIDRLKAKGVRFVLCRNTLMHQGIDPFSQLHGVKREDIVGAAVAEVASLVQQGFVYMTF